jgi:UDP-N-acetylglucosamine 2-epimerase
MSQLRVMTIVGTRPETIRLSKIIPKLDFFYEHTLLHTGQNFDFELNEIFFKELGIRKPDFFLDAAGKNAAETIANIISKVDDLFAKIQPNALLILGDTNSSLAAIPAKRRKIPIFHMEAGNRCFDMRVPEEINRKIVDHIADVNLTYSDIAREYLLREGLQPEQIIKTGSPLLEVIEAHQSSINASNVLQTLTLNPQGYFLVSAHREETVDDSTRLSTLIRALNQLIQIHQLPIIFSTHPRTRAMLKHLDNTPNPLIMFQKPFGFFDYMNLQINAKCVLSDSGSLTEESSICNFPALNIRESQERPEGFEEAAVMLVGINIDSILQGLRILENQGRNTERTLNIVSDYSTNNVSEKIVRIILSYTDYINRVVWKKY